ncbi:hypothetical protein OS493_039915 [Desmophyllum pertusum]|uniref:Uncharacterized protein n=1 Tax=Desmophyllum pertusum TaxID=174260 RepID=A0A9X0CCC9_9CNID|nr:hypothetical protein OS493_039915 [Desmophyllum pertusum]
MQHCCIIACLKEAPNFAEEKAKLRSTSPVLVAVLPETQMQYFDVETKTWKPLSSTTPKVEVTCCCYARTCGNLFVAGKDGKTDCIYCYDIEKNLWERQPSDKLGKVNNMCILDDYMYPIVDCNQPPQRYSFSKRQWQGFAKVGITSDSQYRVYNSGSSQYFVQRCMSFMEVYV